MNYIMLIIKCPKASNYWHSNTNLHDKHSHELEGKKIIIIIDFMSSWIESIMKKASSTKGKVRDKSTVDKQFSKKYIDYIQSFVPLMKYTFLLFIQL